MTIAVIDLTAVHSDETQEAINDFLKDVDADYENAMPFFLGTALDVLNLAIDNEDIVVSPEIARVVGMRNNFGLGRFGLREIWSPFAKNFAPKASRELLATFRESDDQIHTLIIYL